MAEENKDQVLNEEAVEMVEETTSAEEHKSPVDEPYQVFSYKEPESFEYGGNYFVYGMAIGLVIGIILFYLFGQNKYLLSIATIGGAIIGACMKKKGGSGK